MFVRGSFWHLQDSQVSAISPTKCYLLLTKNLNTRSNPIIDIFEGLIKRAFTHLDPVGNSPLIKLLNSFLGISSNMQPNQPPIWFQDLLLSWYSYSRGWNCFIHRKFYFDASTHLHLQRPSSMSIFLQQRHRCTHTYIQYILWQTYR